MQMTPVNIPDLAIRSHILKLNIYIKKEELKMIIHLPFFRGVPHERIPQYGDCLFLLLEKSSTYSVTDAVILP